MKPLSSATYFPFTFISPSLVEAMAFSFHRVVVYQPAYAKPLEALQPWINSGFLDIRSPFEKVIDRKPLEAALQDFRSWGRLHHHADITYLKAVGNSTAPVDPDIPRIVSDIRAMAGRNSKESEENEVPVQVFLHLAQEFDQHSWELREQLSRLNDQYQALQNSFRQDQTDQAHDPILKDLPARARPASPIGGRASQWQAGRISVVEEDPGSLVIKKRTAAWNHLFHKDPARSSLLFTDSRSALAYLLDGVEEKVELFKLNITYTQAESTEVPKDPPPWADHLQEIFNTVLGTQWSRTLQEEVVQAGREIEARIGDWTKSTMKSHDRSVSYRWYLVPGQVASSLLNRRCGLDSGDKDYQYYQAAQVKNTLVGMIEEVRAADF